MTKKGFKQSAKFITKRNLTENVVKVSAKFDLAEGSLSLIYFTENKPTEKDLELCELNCAELIAEFPEIRTAKTECVVLKDYTSEIKNSDIIFVCDIRAQD